MRTSGVVLAAATVAAAVTLGLVFARAAHAEIPVVMPPPVSPAPPGSSPSLAPFVAQDLVPRRQVAVELMAATATQYDNRAVAMNLDLVGRWALRGPLQVFGRVPLALASDDNFDGVGVGNLTAGVTFAPRVPCDCAADLRVGVSAWVALPTAAGASDAQAAHTVALFHYLQFPSRYFSEGVAKGALIDLRYAEGRLAVQAELGVEMISKLSGDEDYGDAIVLVRMGLAAGVALTPAVGIIGELYRVHLPNEGFVGGADAGVRWTHRQLTLGARLFLPLDRESFDADFVGAGLTAALDLR